MTVRRLLIWLSWTYISLAVLLTLILNLAPIEFVDSSKELAYQSWRWIGVAVCIGVLLLCRITTSDTGWTIAGKITAAVVVSLISLVVFGFIGFASFMCAWSERKTIYVHNEDPERRIVLRDFGCGATDSGPPIVKVFEMERLNSWFNYVSKVDTTAIDYAQWRSVEIEK